MAALQRRMLVTFVTVLAPVALLTASARAADPQQPAASPVIMQEFIYETAPFPSCHASTIAETKDGLIAAWFGGTDEGENDVGIWVSRHGPGNGGGKWSPPVEAANGVTGDTRYPCWNPVLFDAAPDGLLMLFYKVGPNPRQWWGMLITSDDAGRTWSKPTRLPDGLLGPVKNKPVRRPDGSLLCASSTEDPEDDEWRVHMETLSRPVGGQWSKTKPLNDARTIGVIQPTILTHPSNVLQILCRSRQRSVAESWSRDGGKTWEPMQLRKDLPNPDSGLDAVTLKDGRHLLVYNHTRVGRSPLNVAVSQDGKTWKSAAVLVTEPGEYSYPAIIQGKDGKVHVTYTWKRQRIRHAVLDPGKFTPKELKALTPLP
jgi:predicted neuraminidase